MNHDLIRAEGSFHSSVHRMMNRNSGKKSHTSPVLAVSVNATACCVKKYKVLRSSQIKGRWEIGRSLDQLGSVLELAEHGERRIKR